MPLPVTQQNLIEETLTGIVDRVTYHNPDNGWSVLKVTPFNSPGSQETVVVHQTKVFAGATMEFRGAWTHHAKFGRQFKAAVATEKKPASAAALEKYLGSGMIKGVGPKTAKKIVRHFGSQTLTVFEDEISRLIEVPGIAIKKLRMITVAWQEHRAIREVMMFLQSHGISTLFAIKIYKKYGDKAIAIVTGDPYRLAQDFFGIGFFSADKVALSIGLAPDSDQRIMAGIRHVLAASREQGHCYLTLPQITTELAELLRFEAGDRLPALIAAMIDHGTIMVRDLVSADGDRTLGHYSRTLYFDEAVVAKNIRAMLLAVPVDATRVEDWINRYCEKNSIALSREQAAAIRGIVGHRLAILTGGPGCGKTTCTRVLVRLCEAMGKSILLAAPTGRAAQRMSEVIGSEAKTIHRLLEWQADRFARNEQAPLECDLLIVDECSMLDISLTASLLQAVPDNAQLLFIGDADQLPSVGAGNVLADLIASGAVPVFRLTEIFRQASQSQIIRYAHEINAGRLPSIGSPFHQPELWRNTDCLFLDSEEATGEQLQFIARVKRATRNADPAPPDPQDGFAFKVDESFDPYAPDFEIPKKFRHVDLERLLASQDRIEELATVLRRLHPWSSLHYSLSAVDVVKKLYLEWIPKYFGAACETQILAPMTRGSLGTLALNRLIQETANPPATGKKELLVGERLFREGDRVIHRRNNYDLGVFNGDIGRIEQIDLTDLTCTVIFLPDQRRILYSREDIVELDLAYAITIHKAQGSEFEAVIIPVLGQHFKMLFRNLIYTGLTRARKLAVFVGSRQALAMAVRNQDPSHRQTALAELVGKR